LSDYEYTIRAHRKGLRCETSADLLIEPNTETTGYHYHKLKEAPARGFFMRYWSKKSPDNPLYWSSFVLLASEPMWVLPNLFRVWIRAGKQIAKAYLFSKT